MEIVVRGYDLGNVSDQVVGCVDPFKPLGLYSGNYSLILVQFVPDCHPFHNKYRPLSSNKVGAKYSTSFRSMRAVLYVN